MKKLLCIITSIALSSTVMAYQGPLNQHLGGYAEVTGGTNLYYVGVLASSGSTGRAGIIGSAASAAFGYNFTPVFALEAGFMQNYANLNGGSHINAPYFTTRFNVPMGQRLSFIGKIGAMAVTAPGEGGLLLPYTGVGFSYAANKNLDIDAQYQGAVYGVAGAGLLGVGLTYHFN